MRIAERTRSTYGSSLIALKWNGECPDPPLDIRTARLRESRRAQESRIHADDMGWTDFVPRRRNSDPRLHADAQQSQTPQGAAPWSAPSRRLPGRRQFPGVSINGKRAALLSAVFVCTTPACAGVEKGSVTVDSEIGRPRNPNARLFVRAFRRHDNGRHSNRRYQQHPSGRCSLRPWHGPAHHQCAGERTLSRGAESSLIGHAEADDDEWRDDPRRML